MDMNTKLHLNHRHATYEIFIAPHEPEEAPFGVWSVRLAGEHDPFAFWEPIHTESLEEIAQDAFALAEKELEARHGRPE